jgi:cytochrome c oxidase subunit 4
MSEPHEAAVPVHRAHATTGTYLTIAAVLTVLTIIEVGAFYIPQFKPILVPSLLTLSAAKFSLVVMFYMHLKFDHKLFRAVFVLPLAIATAVIVGLMFLFRVL